MSHPVPPHPSTIAKLDVTTRRAEVRREAGWWFRYVVHRAIGIGIPECSVSLHRTLRGAERAAARWRRKSS